MRNLIKAQRACVLCGIYLLSVATPANLQAQTGKQQADLIVYGGTASGVMAAYSAGRDGLKVVLLEPGSHLGGMVTGGLSATDIADYWVIGGYARAFYLRAAAHYGVHNLDKPGNWFSEPHVDESIFTAMLKDAGVDVHLHEQLQAKRGVEKSGQRIVRITTADKKQWEAKIYIDSTYEGDLMAEAGVSYTLGRESVAQFGESLAGVRSVTPGHQFPWPMPAFDKNGKLYPEVNSGPPQSAGSGDKKIQSYNFRLILTAKAEDKLPFSRPEGYDRGRFALLEEYLREFEQHRGRSPVLNDFFNPVAIPNNKADFNNNGPISTDYIGHSWAYPEASYAERERIWNDHLLYTESLVYFLSHDLSVPESLRNELNHWGLPKDEFSDTGHWPNQLYVREARRMLGVYFMRQSDLENNHSEPDSIGMGSYNSDSHNIQRVAMPDRTVQNEGDVEVRLGSYEIPYRSIIPKPADAENLLVTVCVSATHVAYSSLRMEPQYMILGQAGGEAAALAVRNRVAVQDISVEQLQHMLRRHGAILHIDQGYAHASD
jgi:hypothetical protein